jgi:bidirectional [NiFe] hydrogenase diaphorase subunit
MTTLSSGPQSSPSGPGADKRLKLLEAALKRHQYQQHALIEVLHAAQQTYGYLGPELLWFIARQLKLPPSKLYGVATFYHFFTLKPHGKHTCVVCTGTACYVKGADALLRAVEQAAHLKAGETTTDGKLSLLTARCFGACGVAPAAVLDDAVKGHLTPEALVAHVKGWLWRGSPLGATSGGLANAARLSPRGHPDRPGMRWGG